MATDIYISCDAQHITDYSAIIDYIKSLGYGCCYPENRDEVLNLIQKSSLFVYLSSSASNSSDQCAEEIGLAVELKKPIYVICVDDSPYNDAVLINLVTADSCLPYLAEDDFKFNVKYSLSNYLGEKFLSDVPENKEKPIFRAIKNLANLKKSAEHGDAAAMYELGTHYLLLDKAKAMKYLKDAANIGHPLAIVECLKNSLQRGTLDADELAGVDSNLKESKDAIAIFELGELYSHELQLDFSYDRAVSAYKSATSQGNETAARRLKEYETLMQQFMDFESGDALAAFKIGLAYEKGEVVEQDTKEAIFWLERASKCELKFATHHLATMYEYGIGVLKNFSTAKTYHETAAEQGHYFSSFHAKELAVKDTVGQFILKDGVYYDPQHPSIIDFSRYSETKRYTLVFAFSSLLYSFLMATSILRSSVLSGVAIIAPIVLLAFAIYSVSVIARRDPCAVFYLRVCMVIQFIGAFFSSLWLAILAIAGVVWSISSDEIKELFPRSYKKTSVIDYVVLVLVLALMYFSLTV